MGNYILDTLHRFAGGNSTFVDMLPYESEDSTGGSIGNIIDRRLVESK